MAVDVDHDAVGGAGAAAPSGGRRARLDRRTIGICVVVALVAAVISGIIVFAVADDSPRPTAGLSTASIVPDTTSFTRFDGTKVTLAQYAGQRLVINFFASTCVPCRKEMPALEQVQRQAGDHITVIGLAVQDDPHAAQALVKRSGVTYDTGQDVTGDLFAKVGGSVLPYTIFVAADGTIMERHTGAMTAATLRSKISSNLLPGG